MSASPRLAALSVLAFSLPAWAGTPSEAVDAFHKALHKNDPARVVSALSPEAILYEQGYAETSRDEWVRRQLGPAIAFERDADRRVLRRESHEAGDIAWVISQTRTTVTMPAQGGRTAATDALALDGAETAILRREGQAWKIVHLHWSAHEAADAPKP